MKKRYIGSLILIILILIVATYFIESAFSFKLKAIENYISSFGPWVPLLLIFMIIVTSSIGFIFMIPVAISALLLNIYLAFLISIIGLTIGASISFYFARYFGRDYFEKKFRKRINELNNSDKGLANKAFWRIFLLRLISLVPYELINIGSGLSRIRFIPFILATLLGIIPGIFITIYFIKSTESIFSMQFLFASLLMAGFSLLPLLSKKVRKIIFNLE